LLGLLSLLYKRQRESPRRPLQIWCFDVSKQVFGAFAVHFVNIAMSNMAGVQSASPTSVSPCVWYFLNVLVDTTLGVPVLWVFLKILDAFCELLELHGTKSGDYGGLPPKWSWWFRQSCIYTVGLALMKTTVFILLNLVPELSTVGEFLLRWTYGHKKLRIFFVMFFFPLIMNIVQYIIIDNILKASTEGVLALSGSDDITSSRQEAYSEGNDSAGTSHRRTPSPSASAPKVNDALLYSRRASYTESSRDDMKN